MMIQQTMTVGVGALRINRKTMADMMDIAKDEYTADKNQYFFAFKPTGNKIRVEDGNGGLLGELEDAVIPETIWIIVDDYGDFDLYTALLPNEY